MERNRIFGILTALMLLLTACQAGTTGDSSGIPVTEKPVQPEESAQTGTTEAFSYGDLSLTVSNVLEKRTDSVFDGMEDFEYEVYVVAPGAVVTVLEADMFEDDDGQPHADWALLLDPEDSYRGADGWISWTVWSRWRSRRKSRAFMIRNPACMY